MNTAEIKRQESRQVADQFRWKTQTNELLRVDEMETRHLFFTLRMIWNHTMPEQAQLKEGNRYSLGSFYTKEYLVDAINEISRELSGRNDIAEDWQRQLDQMISFLAVHQIKQQVMK